MYVVDLEKQIIHDMSFVRYECNVRKIPEDKKQKIYGLNTVKTMVHTSHVPRFNGCQFCMSEYYILDFTTLFG